MQTEWYQEALEICVKEYHTERAYLGGYLGDWGIPENPKDDDAVEYIVHYVRATSYSIAISLNIKEDLEINLTLERLIQNKEFVLEKILEAGESLKSNVEEDVKLMLENNQFSEINKGAQAS